MGLHHRISAKFKSGVEPAAEDKEVKIKYLAGANWKNKKYEGMKGKKGSEQRTKRSKAKVFLPPKEGWNPSNLGKSQRSK